MYSVWVFHSVGQLGFPVGSLGSPGYPRYCILWWLSCTIYRFYYGHWYAGVVRILSPGFLIIHVTLSEKIPSIHLMPWPSPAFQFYTKGNNFPQLYSLVHLMKLLISAFRLKVSKEFLVFCSSFFLWYLSSWISGKHFWSFVLHSLHFRFSFSSFIFLDLFQSKPPSAVRCSCVISPQRRLRHWECLGSILLGERFVSCLASPESEEATLTSQSLFLPCVLSVWFCFHLLEPLRFPGRGGLEPSCLNAESQMPTVQRASVD